MWYNLFLFIFLILFIIYFCLELLVSLGLVLDYYGYNVYIVLIIILFYFVIMKVLIKNSDFLVSIIENILYMNFILKKDF